MLLVQPRHEEVPDRMQKRFELSYILRCKNVKLLFPKISISVYFWHTLKLHLDVVILVFDAKPKNFVAVFHTDSVLKFLAGVAALRQSVLHGRVYRHSET